MHVIHESPMSMNKAYMGAKRKTAAYRCYEVNVARLLPEIEVPEGKLTIYIDVYYSNSRSDLDNAFKPFIDILQSNYGFNDSKIYRIVANKFVVKKGEDRIAFRLEEHSYE